MVSENKGMLIIKKKKRSKIIWEYMEIPKLVNRIEIFPENSLLINKYYSAIQ